LDEPSSKDKSNDKSLIDKMKSSGKSIVIFYGSQTGTAEEYAQRIAKNLRLYGLKALVVDPEETDIVSFIR
jgi:NADPH-ferrihemoprotein reductase